jgi:hypothetical protein
MRLPKLLTCFDLRRLLARLPHKEQIVQNNQPFIYTEDQLMARLKFFIGVCLALTLTGIVFVVLYSLIFVTQPLNAMSPIYQKFFELIVPIATFLTGTLSGIMLAGVKKEDQEAMLAAHKQAADNAESAAKSSAATAPKSTGTGSGSFGTISAASGNWAPAAMAMGSAGGFQPGFGATPPMAADVTTGWGGKAAPPPVTEWPER